MTLNQEIKTKLHCWWIESVTAAWLTAIYAAHTYPHDDPKRAEYADNAVQDVARLSVLSHYHHVRHLHDRHSTSDSHGHLVR